MPADIGTYFIAVSSDGDIYYTVRPPDIQPPTWHSLRFQAGNVGIFSSVAAAGYTSSADPSKFNVNVAATTWDGRLWHTRLDLNGAWTPFVDIEQRAGPKFGGGQWWRVDAYGTTGFPEGPGPFDLFEPYATTTIGQVFSTTRTSAGGWYAFTNLDTSHSGPLNYEIADHGHAFDGSGSIVHRIGVFRGGQQRYEGSLWHLTERWSSTGPVVRSPYVDVSRRAGQIGGVMDASCSTTSSDPAQLHVCAIALDGRLWHTLRLYDWYFPPFVQGWTSFQEVRNNQKSRMFPSRRVACRTTGDTLHVCVVEDHYGYLSYITRHPDGVWDNDSQILSPPNNYPFMDVAIVPG